MIPWSKLLRPRLSATLTATAAAVAGRQGSVPRAAEDDHQARVERVEGGARRRRPHGFTRLVEALVVSQKTSITTAPASSPSTAIEQTATNQVTISA